MRGTLSLFSSVLWAISLLPAPALAQDWLAYLPPCAYESAASRPGTLELLYPRPGFPAVVRHGGELITRIKLRSALMPPPGRQQPRALEGWEAELIGRPLRGPRGEGARPEHRYPVRISNVRPDDPSSLVFRAHIPVPVWVAPGTYDLRLQVPGGGVERSPASVRVIEAEGSLRVGWVGPPPEGEGAGAARREALRALAYHPTVEAWIAHPAWLPALAEVPAAEPLPALLALPEGGIPALLRAGERYLSLGRCEGRFLPFEQAVEGIRARHPGELSQISAARLPGRGRVRVGAREQALPRARAPILQRPGDQLVLELPALSWGIRLSVLLPRSRAGFFLRGAEALYWPSVFLPPEGQAPGLIAHLRAEGGASILLRERRDGGLPAFGFRSSPHPLSGHPTTLSLRPTLPRGTQIFWRYGVDENFLGPSLRYVFSRAGDHPLSVWAIDPRGASRELSGSVRIASDHRDGACAASPPGSGSGGAAAVCLLALGLGWTMGRRRRSPE